MAILKNYEDEYTKAHKRLKYMYKYNYNTDFNDEADLKTPRKYKNRKRLDKEKSVSTVGKQRY